MNQNRTLQRGLEQLFLAEVLTTVVGVGTLLPLGDFFLSAISLLSIGALVLMLVAALFVGNARAFFRVSPGAFLKQGDVASIIEDRLDAAGNALTVASRSDISQTMLDNVREAMDAMEQAQTAREISRSDQRLTSAVSEMVAEASKELEGEDLTMITRAADDFAEQGSFLRQEARTYNEQALEAEALYEKLPTAFILPEPDVYEGI